jgi:serine/threonine protein kinase
MFNLFKQKKRDIEKKPNLDLLNNQQFQCEYCGTINSLIGTTPLSFAPCAKCEAPNFIPYFIHTYWLYKPLGGGGMGSVYKAIYWNNPNWEFAVKILPRERKFEQHLIDSLINEAAIGKTFGRHPHLVAVADYGQYQDEHFAALEFSQGERLDQVIDENDSINQKYILLWALQLLSALQRIWDSGFLYRDMKPQNVMIDHDGNAILFDYGLCIDKNQSINPNSDMVDGSPLYMPPERIVGMPENMSSEIYSLGMVIFHALTKKTYYTSTDAYALAKKHVTSLRVSSVNNRLPNGISPKIAPLVDHMIARIPTHRYQTYKEVAADIRNIYVQLS